MREKLAVAPARAKQPAKMSVKWVLLGEMWNSRATKAAPVVWPTSREVASMPLALPLRWAGAEPTMMLLLGDWKRPNPMPHSASLQMISVDVGCAGNQASNSNPTVMQSSPSPPSRPA